MPHNHTQEYEVGRWQWSTWSLIKFSFATFALETLLLILISSYPVMSGPHTSAVRLNMLFTPGYFFWSQRIKYPCGICGQPVKCNQQGIQCKCWFNGGVSNVADDYNLLNSLMNQGAANLVESGSFFSWLFEHSCGCLHITCDSAPGPTMPPSSSCNPLNSCSNK